MCFLTKKRRPPTRTASPPIHFKSQQKSVGILSKEWQCAQNCAPSNRVEKLLLRFNITVEESLWDQRFWNDRLPGRSGGRGRWSGDSSSNGPKFLGTFWFDELFCNGVKMSGWSSTSKMTPWRWWFMTQSLRNQLLIHFCTEFSYFNKRWRHNEHSSK